MNVPAKLEFGNLEHIKAVRTAEKEAYIEANKDALIKKHWESHIAHCDSCGSELNHDGDKEPDIIVASRDGKARVIMTCAEGDYCDETKEVEIK